MKNRIHYEKIFSNTIVQLLLAVIIGIVVGFYVEGALLSIIISLKHVTGQIIFFLVPLIILGFIAPSIAHLRSNASKMLIFALQDSFGTACNTTGDRALTLITDTYEKRLKKHSLLLIEQIVYQFL